MNWFLALLGYFWFFLGIATILFAKSIRKYYGIFIEGNHPKSMGALAILVGGLLIASIANCGYVPFVLMLGIIQIVKGLYLLFAPPKYVNALIKWWLGTSVLIYRLWGIATAVMGLILLKARL